MYSEEVKMKVKKMVEGGSSIREAAKKARVAYPTALAWSAKEKTKKQVSPKEKTVTCDYDEPFRHDFLWISKREKEVMLSIIAESVVRERIRQQEVLGS